MTNAIVARIDRAFFFSSVRESLFDGAMAQSQVDGMNAILDCSEKWRPRADRRYLAYELGTTFHETDQEMQPIKEIGEGRGHAYGAPTGPWHQTYYGRGDVQLTWERNYRFATRELQALGFLKAGEDLEKDAALALRPDIAFAVLIYGMEGGWFTGRKLDDYFTATASDWVGARRIINGLDQAPKIATYGKLFFAALSPKAPAIATAA